MRLAKVTMRIDGTDGWGGDYVNLWFDSDAFFVRCVNPSGGKIILDDYSSMDLTCDLPDDPSSP